MPPFHSFEIPPVGNNNLSFTLTSDSPIIRYFPSKSTDPAVGWSLTASTGTSNSTNTGFQSSSAYGSQAAMNAVEVSVPRTTTFANASVEVSFFGHGIYICGLPRHQASYSITIDQGRATPTYAQTDVDNLCGGSNILYSDFELPTKSHVVTLNATYLPPGSSLEFWQAVVYSTVPMNGLSRPVSAQLAPQRTSSMNVSFSPASAAGHWYYNTAPFDNTLQTWTCNPGDSMLVQFRDHSAVQLLGTLTANTTGTYSVEFSGKNSSVYMSLDASNTALLHSQTFFFANNLVQAATYTMNITNTGSCLYLDAFETWWSGPKITPPMPVTGGKLAGIVIGAIIGLFVIILIVLGVWWYKIKMEQERQRISVEAWAERGFGRWNVPTRNVTIRRPSSPILIDIHSRGGMGSDRSQAPSSTVSSTPPSLPRHRREYSLSSTETSTSSMDLSSSTSEKLARMRAYGYSPPGLPSGPRPARVRPTPQQDQRAPQQAQYVDVHVEGLGPGRLPLDRFASLIARKVREPPIQEGATWSPPAYEPRTPRARTRRNNTN